MKDLDFGRPEVMFAVILGLLFLFTPSTTISQILSNFLIAGFCGYFGAGWVRQAQRQR